MNRSRAAFAFLLLSAADLATTLAAIRWLGAVEANPLMAPVVAVPWLFVALKLGVASWVAWRFLRRSRKATVYFGLALTSVVVWSNAALIVSVLLRGEAGGAL